MPSIWARVELCGEGMGVEAFSCQFLILVCGSIEYCGKVIGRRAGCLIAGGHREVRRNWEVRQLQMKMGYGYGYRFDQLIFIGCVSLVLLELEN